MGIETLTRPAKRSYEEFKAQEMNGIDKLLFPIPDVDIKSAFAIDKFIESAYGIVYRDRDNQSHVRPYAPGTGNIFDVPRASEKTAISEELRDSVITGIDPTSSNAIHLRKLMDDIVKQHTSGYHITKWKQAINVIFDAEFHAKGDEGRDINLDIDFTRSGDNEITADFTASATQAIAIKAMQDQLIAQGCSQDGMVIFMGATWLADFSTDSGVLAYLDANSANQLLEMQMMPEQLRGTHGVKVLATYRAPGMLAPVFVCTFSPGVPYVAYKGATAAAWITATKAAMISLDSPRFNVLRGVDAYNEVGIKSRFVGDIVFDVFTTNDPLTEFIRSQTRRVLIPANINHTVVSTGTF